MIHIVLPSFLSSVLFPNGHVLRVGLRLERCPVRRYSAGAIMTCVLEHIDTDRRDLSGHVPCAMIDVFFVCGSSECQVLHIQSFGVVTEMVN